ncbi:hypothetical protein [Pseudonocardia lacus]|uniref:hypothetical protein n=1 Tax=Pseudonocardia lacus TaxID=2835865 RepID=UPI001BDC2E39|nr:hypothetical protein [Pseudonocardia lacus]
MSSALIRRLVGLALASAAVTACGNSTQIGAGAGGPSAVPTVEATQLVEGNVPAEVVGNWLGGRNGATTEYLYVNERGRFARGADGQPPAQSGVMVSNGADFIAHFDGGSTQLGRWEYVAADGVETLGVWFGPDLFSYKRD